MGLVELLGLDKFLNKNKDRPSLKPYTIINSPLKKEKYYTLIHQSKGPYMAYSKQAVQNYAKWELGFKKFKVVEFDETKYEDFSLDFSHLIEVYGKGKNVLFIPSYIASDEPN